MTLQLVANYMQTPVNLLVRLNTTWQEDTVCFEVLDKACVDGDHRGFGRDALEFGMPGRKGAGVDS